MNKLCRVTIAYAFRTICRVTDARITMKSLVVVIASGGASYYIWKHRSRILGNATIGLYPNILNSFLPRIMQNLIMDRTRNVIKRNFYPLDGLNNTTPYRLSDNGHPLSGAVRDAARKTIQSFVTGNGLTIFEISPSGFLAPDRKLTEYFAPADLEHELCKDIPTQTDVIVGIDIDYYIKDMSYVFDYKLPCLFHTFQPLKVSGRDGDSHFTIRNNTIEYSVGGGSLWKHQNWDWCVAGEYVETTIKGKTTFEYLKRLLLRLIGIKEVVYTKIHHSRPWENCPDRVFVWTVPQYSVWKFSFLPDNIHARSLKRINYQDPTRVGWNILRHVNKEGDEMINFGREGEHLSVTINKDDYDFLMAMSTQQSASTRMYSIGMKDPRTMSLICQYFTGKLPNVPNPDCMVRACVPKVHWPITSDADMPEVSARAYSAPITTDENKMPMIKRWETMSLSIDRRVTFYKNNKIPGEQIRMYATEFVKLIIPEPHNGIPYSYDETAIELNKPSQVIALKQIWETVDTAPKKVIEAFCKNEPTNKTPRIISAYPDIRFLLKFSRYTLKYRDQVLHSEHNSHWFCPGKTPDEIANLICEQAANTSGLAETDFENLDGSTSMWIQKEIYIASMLRYFNIQYHEEIKQYASYLLSIPAYAKRFNFKYEPGYGVKSGSPPTCDQNTHTSAFVEYAVLRKKYPFLNPEECFKLLLAKFGDDGITHAGTSKEYNKICEYLGLKIKYEKCMPSTGVTFLARVYVDPLSTNTSIQDPLRTWRKLHLTTRDPNVPLQTAAMDRLDGYLVTDGLTPVTSHYCQMIKRNYSAVVKEDLNRENRVSKDREKSYWLTNGGAWPQHKKDIPLMLNVIAARTGFEVPVLLQFCEQMDKCNNPWEFRPLNRDEEPLPYKDTLDEEGVPSEPMDDHQIEKDEQNKRERADPSNNKPSGSRFTSPNSKNKCDEAGRPTNTKGPGKLHPVHGKDREDNEQRSQCFNAKTTRRPSTERPTLTTSKQQSKRTNRNAQTRIEKPRTTRGTQQGTKRGQEGRINKSNFTK